MQVKKTKAKKDKGERGKQGGERTLLRQQQPEAPLHRDPLPRPLVVGREPRWVRRLGHLPARHLLERVDALPAGVEGVHEMHGEDKDFFTRSGERGFSRVGRVIEENRRWFSVRCGQFRSVLVVQSQFVVTRLGLASS